MRFFFLSSLPSPAASPWTPPADLLQHLRALRFQEDEPFLLLDAAEQAMEASLDRSGKLLLHGLVPRPHLDLLPITLATAWPKGPRADALVRRATEAGVGRILPLSLQHSVAGREAASQARLRRWRRLMEEVASQCRLPRLPRLDGAPLPFAELEGLAQATREGGGQAIALSPGTLPLWQCLELHPANEVLLAIGPEGGFSATEEATLSSWGFLHAGLSPTILRIEAAGPLAASICQHQAMCRRPH